MHLPRRPLSTILRFLPYPAIRTLICIRRMTSADASISATSRSWPSLSNYSMSTRVSRPVGVCAWSSAGTAAAACGTFKLQYLKSMFVYLETRTHPVAWRGGVAWRGRWLGLACTPHDISTYYSAHDYLSPVFCNWLISI